MGSAIAVTVLKVAFLALLWIFILIAASVIRTDMFGRKVAASDLPRTDLDEPRRGRARSRHLPRRVMITNGPQAGIEADLSGGVVRIGRSSDCQLILDDDYVSTRHGQITVRTDGLIVAEDLGSTNGTYVNGQRITQPTQITPADTVRIGRTQLKLDS